jgi:hypothetical protein
MRKSFTLLPLGVCLSLSFQTFAQNTALELNDTNYVAYFGDAVNEAGDFTVEFWAYVPALIQDGQMHQFISQGDPTLQSAFYMGYDASGYVVVGNQWDDANGNPISTNVPMPVGQWTHLAFTYSLNYDTVSFMSTASCGLLMPPVIIILPTDRIFRSAYKPTARNP